MSSVLIAVVRFMHLFTLLIMVDGTDFCKVLTSGGAEIVGMPREHPKKAVAVKSCHKKNMRGFELMANQLNMSFEITPSIANDADIVWSCDAPVDTPRNRLTIMGPEFDIFPGDKSYSGWRVARYTEGHSFYVSLSDWNIGVHAGMGGWKYPMVSFKYPVDTERFDSNNDMRNRSGGFIYFKRRHPKLLAQVRSFLKERGIEDTPVFDYVTRYKEHDFLTKLHTAAWGIWIGSHESQGFAFQESLSMNVPLMVLDAESMRDEGGGCPGGPWCHFGKNVNLNATTATSWSSACGELLHTYEQFAGTWDRFQRKVNAYVYAPRSLVMTAVAPKPCTARLMQMYNLHRNNWCEQYLQERDRPSEPKKNYFNMSVGLCHYNCLEGEQLF